MQVVTYFCKTYTRIKTHDAQQKFKIEKKKKTNGENVTSFHLTNF